MEVISQIFIACFGITSSFLVANKNKWGFVFGLCSQPFWIYTTIAHKQYGMIILTVIYTFNWAYGCYKWFKK